MLCYNGEVSVEPCADFRQEICIESDIKGFKTASCRANKWQDCYAQNNKKDCENADKRDCKWISSKKDGADSENSTLIKCVPKFAPGFNFWEIETEADSICSQASRNCEVKYKVKLNGDKECIENCECLKDSWKNEQNTLCTQLGDCGSSLNYQGAKGYG